jgi:hypothetical protein
MNQDEDVHRLDEMFFFICYHYRGTLFRIGPLGCLTWFTNPPKWLINLLNTIKTCMNNATYT